MFFFLVTLAFVYCFRERIKQAIILLKIGAEFVAHNFNILYLPLFSFGIFLFYLVIWLIALSGITKLDEENGLRGTAFLFVFQIFWVMEILNAIIYVSAS